MLFFLRPAGRVDGRFLPRLAFAGFLAFPGGAAAQMDQLQQSYDFLLRGRTEGGVLFNFSNEPSFESGIQRSRQALSPPTGNYLLPRSYYDSAAYWGVYVCGGAGAACAINDTYNMLSYQLSPAPGPAGKLQVERVNAHNGANIYDAATWQIAVMLGAVKNKFHIASPTTPYAFASSLSDVLHQGGLISEGNTAPGAKRAVTAGPVFVYNGGTVTEGKRAYAFRALAPEWLARDPLMGSPHASWITASNLPPLDRAYEAGKISWTDWKPITGENAWAFLIGPLQAAHIHYVLDKKMRFVPFKERAVQNALDVLPTFAAMQSVLGAVYYAPAGTIGNEGETPVNPYEVSVENNFSLYAGLRILRSTLQAELDAETALDLDAKNKIKDALHLIAAMIDGGQIGEDRRTRGLLSFFKNAAWRNGHFVQGGLANDPGQSRDWIPTTEPLAVDVQTWGIAALGTKQIDQWFGDGASFEMWRHLKTWGAYGVGKTLWGVGYSDRDGNGMDQGGAYRQGVLSGEWTAGAINAVRNMMNAYGAAPKYAGSLQQDEAAMLAGITTLRIDRYVSTGFPGKPADYAKLISLNTKPYLYASKRYRIPFGWYANPLPSTASTAWVIMIAGKYDPFGFGGVPN